MIALLAVLLLAAVGVGIVFSIIGGLLATIYTIPYWRWIRRQHASGRYTGWPLFSLRHATKLYLAKLTRSAI